MKNAIKRAYALANPGSPDPGVRVESEDLEMAKRIGYRKDGIQLVGRI